MIKAIAAAIAIATALPAVAAPPPNPYHEQLLRMDATARNAVFRRTIRESGLACKRVVSSRFQQPYKNLMMWTVECDPARSIAIYIGTDSSVQPRYCQQSALLKLPACAKPR